MAAPRPRFARLGVQKECATGVEPGAVRVGRAFGSAEKSGGGE
jgi:hypothetical protein